MAVLLPAIHAEACREANDEAEILLRALAPLLKARVCLSGNTQLYTLMESLGGVGYTDNSECEPLNISRLVRDGMVLAIWEGTTDVLSTECVRALTHTRSGIACLRALDGVVTKGVVFVRRNEISLRQKGCDWIFAVLKETEKRWNDVKSALEVAIGGRKGKEQAEGGYENVLAQAREITLTVAEVLMMILGLLDAASTSSENDNGEIHTACKRWARDNGFMPKNGLRKDNWDGNLEVVFGRANTDAMVKKGSPGSKARL